MSLFDSILFNQGPFGGDASAQSFQPVSKLIYAALRKAAVTLGPQRTPSAAQFEDGLEELNRLIGSLNCDRLNIYAISRYQFPLTGAATYTIGQVPGLLADFDAPRPQLIESANIVDVTGTIRYPLALFTSLQWARITYQTIPNTIPTALYNDRANPVSTLYLWGQPQPGQTLELFTWTQVPTFQNLSDQVTLPLQYEDALVLNLAVRLVSHFPLAPNVPRQVDPNLYQQARESLMRLESINAPQPVADTSALCSGSGSGYNRWNIYSDQYRR
jgi:hypothetical protein